VYEWDENKRLSNIDKHGVDFADMVPLFGSDEALVMLDNREDYGEERYILFCPFNEIVFHVAFTRRNETIRIISARKANKRERKYYEQRKYN